MLINRLRERARKNPREIYFPEGNDPRVQEAGSRLAQEGLAKPVLVFASHESAAKVEGCWSVRPDDDPARLKETAEAYYEKRRSRGITFPEASDLVQDPLVFSSMQLALGRTEGVVVGASYTTAETVRASLQCVGLRADRSILSSFFLMLLPPHSPHPPPHALLFADCAVVPEPTSSQLAEIGLETAENTQLLLEEEPRIALLSFSSHGSASHPAAAKVAEAAATLRSRAPELISDGELQADAALIPSVAELKAPGSVLEGAANTLIFPDLNSANIAYKLTERLAGAQAIGPIFQGLDAPLNDLSRGCSVRDIVNVSMVTVLQAQERKRNVDN